MQLVSLGSNSIFSASGSDVLVIMGLTCYGYVGEHESIGVRYAYR